MQGLFSKILDMSITGSVVIAVVLLARLALRRAPKIYSYLLWSVVLFRLLCPLSISAGVSVLEPMPVQTTTGLSTVSYRPVRQAMETGGTAVSREETAISVPEKKTPAPLEIAAWVWLAGVGCMALMGLIPFLRLRHRLSEAVPAGENVYLADGIPTPFVLGLVKPRIYLPSGTPETEKAFILAHERHHIRRGDHVWKLLGYAALCLHWFDPLVWLSFHIAGKDMEMSCDEAVIKALGEDVRADYAQALLRISCRKSVPAGMPLAFGEGDTTGRVKNLARWRRPRVWVSALCGAVCVGLLAACALNPKKTEKPLEDLTRIDGLASVGVGELYFTLPEGYAAMSREDVETANGYATVLTYGTETVGGVKIYTAPENLEQEGLDGISLLPLSELSDSSLGWYADGDWSQGVSVEFFSDVPEEQPRTLLNQHNLYLWEGLVYDLWFDELTVEETAMYGILDSVRLGTAGSWEIDDLPDGFTVENGTEIRNADGEVVGGIASYQIPDGVYDPGDTAYLWLERLGIPDLEMQLAGMFAWEDDNGCQMTLTDDFQVPTVRRIHNFTVSGSMLYDLWLDDLLLDINTQTAIRQAIRFPIEAGPTEKPTPEDEAFSRAQTVMNRALDGNMGVRVVANYQNHPEQNNTMDLFADDEIGGLWLTQAADGLTRGALYLYGTEEDRYFEGQGPSADSLRWTEAEMPEELSVSWLGSFSFVKAYVTYQSTLTTENTDLFRIDRPFGDGGDGAEVYWASFVYDAEGNFIEVSLQVNPATDNAYTLTESILTTDRKAVAGEIEKAAKQAEQ